SACSPRTTTCSRSSTGSLPVRRRRACAVAGSRAGTAAALVLAALAIGAVVLPLAEAVRAKPPSTYATWATICALGWLLSSTVALAVLVGGARSWPAAADRLAWLLAPFAAGFAAQLVSGALSYLLPVVLRGGPKVTRAMNHELDRGLGWRLVLINLGAVLFSLPVPSLVKVVASMLGLVGLASFAVLAVRAVIVSHRQRERELPPPASHPRTRVGGALAGLVVVTLAVAGAVALDPQAVNGSTSAADGVTATGHTTEVSITAKDMRFTPGSIDVPAGDRLVLKVTNGEAAQVHDLVLDTGHTSGRLSPGQTASIDVGIVGRSIEGWCSVVGHRQMGMVLHIRVTGSPVAAGTSAAPGSPASGSHAGHPGSAAASTGPAADAIDLSKKPPAEFVAHDPTLPPAAGTTTHKVTLTVQELVTEVAPGVSQQLWTYNGSTPGPTLRGKIGDTFEVTLVNDGAMGHSIDFHAGEVSPDANMRTIAPGESLVYTFTADHSGIWLYHCSTMPMSAHIASGMYGAVIIDPPDLAPVDREYLLVQSEYYLGQLGGPTDPRKIATMQPDLVTFNGYANQYDAQPLAASVGQRVRVWVLTAGPNLGTSFHVVGGQFDTVYKEGAFLLRPGSGGAQTLDLAAAQGGFVELVFKQPGSYPFVDHVMALAERGAHGHFVVTP
ncbi:multicopper oxidase domain-containing protein, partial [Cumulibacter manganitolerans]|uniref:multicopper oxidase domain-containing protein n=1 Tax=Cumulibacter manganitolerans TaxID=1884992 RepID=UPI001E6411F4